MMAHCVYVDGHKNRRHLQSDRIQRTRQRKRGTRVDACDFFMAEQGKCSLILFHFIFIFILTNYYEMKRNGRKCFESTDNSNWSPLDSCFSTQLFRSLSLSLDCSTLFNLFIVFSA